MRKIVIDEHTPKDPLTLIGKMVGPCYGSDTSDPEKNKKRGIQCIKDGHYRVLEYATVWFTVSGYSARWAREFYTHIGGAPTRTQASTRYIDEGNFDYYIPPSIEKEEEAKELYINTMDYIKATYMTLLKNGFAKEDAAGVLPLNMSTTISCHFNARTLMTMTEQRLCNRALLEYREFMRDFLKELSSYSEEWKELCDLVMKCKCDKAGWCEEKFSCGKYPKKEEIEIVNLTH